MRPLDLAVIVLYALAMLAVGRYYKSQVHTTDDYLLGNRRMNPFMIGLSLFATLTSTLSYLAYPGEIIGKGPMMFAQLASYPLIMLIVGWILIPRIMQERGVTSGYELLELRLGLPGRLLGAGMFMSLRTVWMASILYATSTKVVVPLLGLAEWAAPIVAIVLGVITIIYSAEGGIRAVVMTDAMQSIIMFAGAIVVISVVSVDLGGATAWWPQEWETHWQKPVFWFRASERVTFMGAALNFLVWMTCTAGSDQMAIQRYLSTRDARTARRSFGVHLLAEVVISMLLAFTGLAILRFYVVHPELLSGNSIAKDADKLLSLFIVGQLPAGLAGIVIAAILSAAMSSLSSGMNSASAVIINDFVSRVRTQDWTMHENLRATRLACIAVGVVAVLLSLVVGRFTENLLELCVKVVNLLTAPLFVLFVLALFVPWAKPRGAVAATVASVSCAVGIAFFPKWFFGLEMLWVGPIAFAVGLIVGCTASLGGSNRIRQPNVTEK